MARHPIKFRIFSLVMGIWLTGTGSLEAHAKSAKSSKANDKLHAKQKRANLEPIKIVDALNQNLKRRNFAQVIRSSKTLLNHPNYADYARWYQSRALYEQALELEASKAPPKEIQSILENAIPILISILQKNPYSPLLKKMPKELALMELLLGRLYFKKGQHELAETVFERAFQRLNAASSLIFVGSENIESYAESCSKKPSPLCKDWLHRMAVVLPKASSEFQKITAVFPKIMEEGSPIRAGAPRATQPYKAPDLDQVAFDAALKALFDGNTSAATKAFKAFLTDFPRSTHKNRAKYWLAESFKRAKSDSEANATFSELRKESPVNFYGFLSALAQGQSVKANVSNTSLPPELEDRTLPPADKVHFNRAQEFLKGDLPELAALELKELRIRETLSIGLLMNLARMNTQARNFGLAFSVLSGLFLLGNDVIATEEGLQILFPSPYLDEIRKSATVLELDPILMLSLVKQESGFDPEVISGPGAVGLTQVLPSTALDVDALVPMEKLLEPQTNIGIGLKYFRRLLKKYSGNSILAIAAYNAGPGNVDRWIKDISPQRKGLEFIELIPFKETREYVQAILRNYAWYSFLIPGTPPRELQSFWMERETPPPSPTPASN